MKRYIKLFLFLICLMPVAVWGHVGSSGVIVQKQAGKYQLLISVNPPDVVPGTAKVTVIVESGNVQSIMARPVYFWSGDEGAPSHDELTPVKGMPGRFEGVVWLMDSGSSSIQLELLGPDGKEMVVAPVVSMATAQRDMPAGTGVVLAILGVLLVILMVTIIGASSADSVIKPGVAAPARLGRKRLIGMGIGGLVLVLMLTGGRFWWNSWAANYQNHQLYKRTKIKTTVAVKEAQPVLTVQIDSSEFSKRGRRRMVSFILPDHGKLMHVFLVRTPGLDAFAHLHPDRRDTLNYESKLPNLPGGKYLVYADVVYRSGFAETMVDTVEVPSVKVSAAQAAARTQTDPDDSWLVTEPMGVKSNAIGKLHLDDDMVACGKPSASVKLDDGSTMFWNDKPGPVLEANQLYTLRFAVADEAGKPAKLEPYLGMQGHAAIVRSDGTVYIHLHPVGTYSMAAEETLLSRIADTTRSFKYPNAKQFRDSIDAYVAKVKTLPEAEKNKLLMSSMPAMNHTMKTNNMVEFPYAFPRAGHYRIWVQVKRNGKVLTGVFDTQVKETLM
ncbi:hypothetical protein [Arsenicibacter rosenii]|uniref:Uncharacterized protein n=1 Tax=Arsenicibacter rosenii TaxID=1750698 RepID=A0A1S2VMW8_9BACT|nr:hypothetical protein [Arsenicibacter rosenii]OIN60117.1 hypothetical protein BLX24_04540 [Arsenicibacter rosenii]